MSYPIPDEALANHIAILGKTGSGKSNAAKTLAERALDRSERVCILDPTGTWFGLRLTRKGKPSPYKVVIFGGKHGDLPIGAAHGAAIAETVGTTSTPAVIDTRLMTVGDRTRFFTDFAEALLRTNQGPLTLIIDEAHLFAPQSRVNDPKSSAMVHAANNLVSLGRGLGLRIVLISQRPAKLHKDSLTQVETLVAMRLIAPQDREAVRDWIKEAADLDQGREIISSMASLPTGDAWVWSPEIGVLHRGRFPLAGTFDSGSAPVAGEAGPALAALDLAAVTARLQQVAADVVANDPRALKAEIARLKAEAAKAPVSAPAAPTGPTPAEVEAVRRAAFLEGVEEGEKRGNPAGQALMLTRVRLALDALKVDQAPEPSIVPAKSYAGPPPPSPAPRPAPPPRAGRVVPAAPLDGEVTAPIRKVLDAVAWWNAFGRAAPSSNQVGFIAGYSPTGGTFKRYRGEARTRGLLTYPSDGRLALTEAGAELAQGPDAPPTVAALHDAVRANLDGPLVKLLDPLLEAYPETMTAEAVGDWAGYEASGGTFKRYRGQLKTLEIIDYPGPGLLRAADWLFPGAN